MFSCYNVSTDYINKMYSVNRTSVTHIDTLVLCLGWNVRLIVSLPRRYDVMTLRKPIVTWYVKTFRNVNYVC